MNCHKEASFQSRAMEKIATHYAVVFSVAGDRRAGRRSPKSFQPGSFEECSMRSVLWFAMMSIVAIAAHGHAQEPSKPSDKTEITKGIYMVTGLH